MTAPPAPDGREREILYRVIQIASSSLQTDAILSEIVDLVSEALRADACHVYLWDPEGEVLTLRAGGPAGDGDAHPVRLRLGEGVVGWAAEHRESVLLRQDAAADPRRRSLPELDSEHFQTMLSVPIISRADTLIGAINLHGRTPGQFSEDDQLFLESAASLIAGGIENAQLFQLARRKEEALAALMRETIQVQEEERRRVATEIHDGVTQQLVSIWFRVHAIQRLLERNDVAACLEEVAATKDVIDETLVEARSAIYNLRPATLDDLGLVAALHELAARFTSDTGVEVDVSAAHGLALSPHAETALYRITQEALTNVKKHAAAGTVSVSLAMDGETLVLTVTDDGVGFDVDAFRESRAQTCFGLAGMRERIELLNGQLGIRSTPSEGTSLHLRVPVGDELKMETA